MKLHQYEHKLLLFREQLIKFGHVDCLMATQEHHNFTMELINLAEVTKVYVACCAKGLDHNATMADRDDLIRSYEIMKRIVSEM